MHDHEIVLHLAWLRGRVQRLAPFGVRLDRARNSARLKMTFDKLDRLVAEAKREEQIAKGEKPEYVPDIESYRGKFAQNLRKADPDRRRLHPGVAIAIIVVLLILWHYLMTGSFRF
jgi:hypothetical protein